MNAKHYANSVGLYIHADFDISKFWDRRKFYKTIKSLPGVETVSFNKYSVAIGFGYMFDGNLLKILILDTFLRVYKANAYSEIGQEDVLQKAYNYASKGISSNPIEA